MSSLSVSHPPALAPLGVLVVAAASLLLAACGGSSSTNAAATERSEEQKAETKFADFAKCLREHGVNAEAVSQPGGAHGLKVRPGQAGPSGTEAAERACARYRPEPQKGSISPQQKVEREEQVRKFAKCMRDHGIKVEATANGEIQIHVNAGEAGAPNPESPVFQKAQQACQGLLPFKGQRGKAPPGHTARAPGSSESTSSAGGA